MGLPGTLSGGEGTRKTCSMAPGVSLSSWGHPSSWHTTKLLERYNDDTLVILRLVLAFVWTM